MKAITGGRYARWLLCTGNRNLIAYVSIEGPVIEIAKGDRRLDEIQMDQCYLGEGRGLAYTEGLTTTSRNSRWSVIVVIEQIIDFLKEAAKIFLTKFAQMLSIFSIGTGAAAIACWVYDAPVSLSLLGGILALGIFLGVYWFLREW